MTTHIKGLTYAPKIAAVINDTCRQTIRAGNKIKPGDKIIFHGWEGRPYRSNWSWQKRVKVESVFQIIVYEEGIVFDDICDGMHYLWNNKLTTAKAVELADSVVRDDLYYWDCKMLTVVASEDAIEPATGEALRDVLFKYNGVPGKDGIRCQIIRW